MCPNDSRIFFLHSLGNDPGRESQFGPIVTYNLFGHFPFHLRARAAEFKSLSSMKLTDPHVPKV